MRTSSSTIHIEISNGSAWPFLNRPVINLWASPAEPREDIGQYRDWGEMLVSHEFGHIAHLSRPSRNPLMRLVWQLLPVDLGPITLNSPRWVVEGYATFIEGRVTGSGRPHGSWRPAFLRQLALEGQLPRYEQLDGSSAYEGGEFAYLAGSAFIEWLAARHGDSSLVHLWRRMTARETRDFDQAFVGVYGESPRALYGHFSTDLTAKSLEVARLIAANSVADTGEIIQRLSWNTGDPSISQDGKRAAIVLSSPTRPSRVVLWNTAAEPDTGRARRDSILLAHDPEDVPARSIYPPPKRALATLRARGGSGYESPRFMADGRILLSRNTARGDGSLSSDLYIWSPERASVRRVTRGASLRDPDPFPDGRSAIAARCRDGWCDVVRVDLATGAVGVLLRGSPTVSYYRPRMSPDGSRFVVAVNRGVAWTLVVADPSTGASFDATPDARVNCYDASWVDATSIVAVSDHGGIANLEEFDLRNSSWRAISNVTGAAVAPTASRADGSIWFLSLYSRGYDVRRVYPLRDTLPILAGLPATLSPAVPVPTVAGVQFRTGPVSESRPYGFGPRLVRWLPQPQVDADGAALALAIVSGDVVGKSELLANGAYGGPATWRGAEFSAAWHGALIAPRLRLFDAVQEPSRGGESAPAAAALDARLSGVELTADGTASYDTWAARYRLGGTIGQARLDARSLLGVDSAAAERSLVFGDLSFGWRQRGDDATVSETLGGSALAGRSFDQSFNRGIATASIATSGPAVLPLRASATYGASGSTTVLFERFALGGSVSPLINGDELSQRFAMPVLPTGTSIGSSALTYRLSLNTEPLAVYWWAGSTAGNDNRFDIWHRVIGVEWTDAIAAVPVIGTPAARGQIGIGESLDAPFRHRVRAYVGMVIDP